MKYTILKDFDNDIKGEISGGEKRFIVSAKARKYWKGIPIKTLHFLNVIVGYSERDVCQKLTDNIKLHFSDFEVSSVKALLK